MSRLRPVVLSGGSGTRLWPLSTPELPKQFVPLFEDGSLFELTLHRLDGIEDVAAPLVVTGSSHTHLVRDVFDKAAIGIGHIIVEPIGRNTAPAAIAAAVISSPDDVLVIVPSDHLISDVPGFQVAVKEAAGLAASGGIVTFGIQPSRPETGYGYIEMGEPGVGGASPVVSFKEKPDVEEASRFVSGGRHVWNSGMFIAKAGHLLEEAALHCPDILEGVRDALPEDRGELIELGETFRSVEAISFDHAIMERTEQALVVPIEVGWDDVGSYESLWSAVSRDHSGNHVDGDVTAKDVDGSFIRATSRRVVVAGVSGLVIVETPEAVLVLPLHRSQEVRDLSRQVDQG